MSVFCEDDRQLASYPNGIIGMSRGPEPLIKCLEWSDTERTTSNFKTVQEFIAQERRHPLRVAFLPIAPVKEDLKEAAEFRTLFRHYSIPSAVPAERMRSVNHAFGASKSLRDKSEIAWFHWLSRNVKVENGVIIDLGYLRSSSLPGQGQTQDPSAMWLMCDFFLHIAPAAAGQNEGSFVTLLCFGAPPRICERFELLLKKDEWKDTIVEPYLLFNILFDELHALYDQLVWKLSEAVNPAEQAALVRADVSRGLFHHNRSFSFQDLHNIQKNTVFMVEAARASMSTLDAMATRLRRTERIPATPLTAAAADTVDYQKRIFDATCLRLQSIEKRISNVIQMSQTIVTQDDSAVLKADSRAMKLIAALTLIFLPATGVASIFDTPFFDNDFETSRMIMAANFWVFWAVAVPMTVGVGGLCCAWYYLPRFTKEDRVGRFVEQVLAFRPLARISKRGREDDVYEQDMRNGV